ncbi:hypothetical protein BSNK01_11410 [Bacillaceae bacterium]
MLTSKSCAFFRHEFMNDGRGKNPLKNELMNEQNADGKRDADASDGRVNRRVEDRKKWHNTSFVENEVTLINPFLFCAKTRA